MDDSLPPAGARESMLGTRITPAGVELALAAFDKVARQFSVSAGAGVMLTGSLAEGLGNGYSDIDIEIIDDGTSGGTVGRHYSHLDGQRIEVFFREPADLTLIERRVRNATSEDYDPNLLKTYHNFCFAYPIRNAAAVAAATKDYSVALLCARSAAAFSGRAQLEASKGRALITVNRADEAIHHLREAAMLAAMTWAARRGETFLGSRPKWLVAMLRRAGLDAKVHAAYQTLLRETPRRPEEVADRCRDLFGRFGVADACFDAAVEIRICDGVRAWDFGGALHVVNKAGGCDRLYRLNEAASRALRSAQAGECATHRGARFGKLASELGALHLHGLASLSVAGHLANWKTPISPQQGGPVSIGFDGLVVKDDEAVVPATIDPQAFAEAGGALLMASFDLANAREDLAGAYEAEQWEVFEMALEKAVRVAADGVVASQGIRLGKHPSLTVLEYVRSLPVALYEECVRVARMRVGDADEARAAAQALHHWLATLPVDLLDPRVSRTHETSLGFLNMLQLAKVWAPMLKDLGVPLPTQELEYTLDVAEGKERSKMKLFAMGQMAAWRREIELPVSDAKPVGIGGEVAVLLRSVVRHWRAGRVGGKR